MSATVILNGNALRPDHVLAVGHGARVVLGGEAKQAMAGSAAAFGNETAVLERKRRQLLGGGQQRPLRAADVELEVRAGL